MSVCLCVVPWIGWSRKSSLKRLHQPKDDLGENIPGRVNLKDKGPELGASIACLRSNRATVGSSE